MSDIMLNAKFLSQKEKIKTKKIRKFFAFSDLTEFSDILNDLKLLLFLYLIFVFEK